MDDSEADLIKLVNQLARRIPNLELDTDVVKSQVKAFKQSEVELLKKLELGGPKKLSRDEVEESAVAKLSEEMKSLPSRIAERLAEVGEAYPRRRPRRIHPMMLDEVMHTSGDPGDPVGILMAASLIRDEIPWLYELAMEAYRTIKDGKIEKIESEIRRIRRFADFAMRGPLFEELGLASKENHILMVEFPRMLDRSLMRALEMKAMPRSSRQSEKS